MATAGQAMAVRAARGWTRPKYLVFAVLSLATLYVLRHNESFLINGSDPEWQHIRSFRWWLLPHALAGACALLLAPLQFSDRLRQRWAKMHRVVGRIYVAGTLISAPLGAYIQWHNEALGGTRTFSVAATVQAVLWLSTTLVALYFIRIRKVEEHRQWMTRSFAVSLVFVFVRVISGFGKLDADLHAVEAVVWFCNVMAIPMADFILQGRTMLQSRSVARLKAQAATARG